MLQTGLYDPTLKKISMYKCHFGCFSFFPWGPIVRNASIWSNAPRHLAAGLALRKFTHLESISNRVVGRILPDNGKCRTRYAIMGEVI